MSDRPDWMKNLKSYGRPSHLQAAWQLTNTFIPYIGLWALMLFTVYRGYSYWLTLALAVPAAAFLIRIFIFFHDCVHGSFFRSRTANHWLGRITGVMTFTPFMNWRISHLKHHATSGDLDRRGLGDVWLMTVDEYLASSKGMRLAYRLYRNPLVMFGIGPAVTFFVVQRRPDEVGGPRGRRSVIQTNIAVLAVAGVAALTIGIVPYILIQLPVILMAGVMGLWLFYVQHDFDGVRWNRHDDWDFLDASMTGSSYYKLPRILQWFSGNIGLHHVHHVRPGIPNYNLQRCHDDTPALQEVPPLTLARSLRSLWLNVWDEKQGRLVSFRELRGVPRGAAADAA